MSLEPSPSPQVSLESALGQVLVTMGLITPRQLETAAGADTGMLKGLVASHLLEPAELEDVVAFWKDWQQAHSLASLPVVHSLISLVPPPFALRRLVLPLRTVGKRLLVAYPEALQARLEDTRLLDEIGLMTGRLTLGWPLPGDQIKPVCAQYYDPRSAKGAIHRALEAEAVESHGEHAPSEEVIDAPIIDLVKDLLFKAVELNASDLHLDPQADGTIARMRIDGVMRDYMTVPKPLKDAVVNRLKLISQLNITEHRLPQDGRFSFSHGAVEYDVRLATIPTRWGELVVMRLLRPLAAVKSVAELGFQPGDLARYQRLINAPHGILLVTGPTGSGKSSTLYTTLQEFDRVENHVVSIEDPIEYAIDRVMQIQVNTKAGLTFAAALRSILRLDPDIILVGEIRDHETLQIAIDAAMTGHLVLATLHTNDAASSIARMAEMRVEGHRIAACLVGVVAQRLVRKLCVTCRQPYEATPEEMMRLGTDPTIPQQLYWPVGCEACGNTGFKGRMGLFEVLEVDTPIAQAITDGQSTLAVQRLAAKRGMGSLAADGRQKVLAGLTTLKEVDRLVREGEG